MDTIQEKGQVAADESDFPEYKQDVGILACGDREHPPTAGHPIRVARRVGCQPQNALAFVVLPPSGIMPFVLPLSPHGALISSVVVEEQVVILSTATGVVRAGHPITDHLVTLRFVERVSQTACPCLRDVEPRRTIIRVGGLPQRMDTHHGLFALGILEVTSDK
jgi:hypothetical protein